MLIVRMWLGAKYRGVGERMGGMCLGCWVALGKREGRELGVDMTWKEPELGRCGRELGRGLSRALLWLLEEAWVLARRVG